MQKREARSDPVRGGTNSLIELGPAGADADGDGATDAQESGADTDPCDAADTLRVLSLVVSPGSNVVAWTVRPTRLYRLETVSALPGSAAPWDDAGDGTMGPLAGATATNVVPGTAATSAFYRVRAVLPLAP